MKYFFDTEFIEGWKKPIKWLPTIGNFNKPYHSIQLISIGIVAEDGREYYAVSKEYNYWDANNWVKENVILPMWKSLTPAHKQFSEPETFHKVEGSDLKTIAWGILRFCNPHSAKDKHEFYAYYADYDWVVFCSIFGSMMNLPKGFPMYCRDLKQQVDEFCEGHDSYFGDLDKETRLEVFKAHSDYPKQGNEHHALDDAKWNFKLYKFIKGL